jgi:hypothetical protein
MVQETYVTPTQAGLEMDPPVGADYVRELVDLGKLPARRVARGIRLIPLSAVRTFDLERRQRRKAREVARRGE